MTREKAIEMCKSIKHYLTGGNPVWSKEEVAEAMTMAIKALENERPKGHWILSQSQDKEDTDNGNYRFECSNCGYSDTHSKATKVPYCWHCGADMRGE